MMGGCKKASFISQNQHAKNTSFFKIKNEFPKKLKLAKALQ
jgi:hypothetical protein